MSEKVLLVVHRSTAEGWYNHDPLYASATEEDSRKAGKLLKRLAKAASGYHRVIEFEDNPWNPDIPSTATFTWAQVANQIGMHCDVDVAGVKRSVCVAKVTQRLKEQGMRVKVIKRLTLD